MDETAVQFPLFVHAEGVLNHTLLLIPIHETITVIDGTSYAANIILQSTYVLTKLKRLESIRNTKLY